MSNKKLNKKGFTLIEVVLVLAIGGLIFLLAFLAFRQASVNRRDTQRRSDAARTISELQNYSGDNQGAYPANNAYMDATFIPKYMQGGGSTFNDPKLNTTYTSFSTATNVPAGNYYYRISAKCSGNDISVISPAQNGSVAVVFGLEKGQVCRDNS